MANKLEVPTEIPYTERMKNKKEKPINIYIKSQNPSDEDKYIKDLMERRRRAFYEEN